MRAIFRACLVGVLVGCLIEMPVWGSPSRSLGIVAEAQNARLGVAEAFSGATIFAGDTAQTDAAGRLRLRIGQAQLYLPASSAIKLGEPTSGVTATIVQGTVGFASRAEDLIELNALDVIIRPASAEPTHGEVTLLGPDALLVTSFRGSLTVEVDGERFLAPAGTTYHLELVASPQEPQGAEKKKAKRRRAAWILFGTGVTLGLAAFIACRAAEGCGASVSPDVP